MHPDIATFNDAQADDDREICRLLATCIDQHLAGAESKIWHRHPVWFLDGNPIVGYSRLKAGMRLMFWSGADFGEERLSAGTGKFKDASVLYTSPDQVIEDELKRWLKKAQEIQWDYGNIRKHKGLLKKLAQAADAPAKKH